MPCERHGNFIIYSRRSPPRWLSPPRRCAYCEQPHAVVCDGEKAGGKTCDVPMCRRCSFSPKANVDLCRDCRVTKSRSEDDVEIGLRMANSLAAAVYGPRGEKRGD